MTEVLDHMTEEAYRTVRHIQQEEFDLPLQPADTPIEPPLIYDAPTKPREPVPTGSQRRGPITPIVLSIKATVNEIVEIEWTKITGITAAGVVEREIWIERRTASSSLVDGPVLLELKQRFDACGSTVVQASQDLTPRSAGGTNR